MVRRRRWPYYTLAIPAITIAILLAWSSVEPASAKPGYTCAPPSAGHGGPSCHAPATTAPPTTAPPATAPPTTAAPGTAPPTSKATQSGGTSGSSAKSGSPSTPTGSTVAPATDGSTTTSEGSTTTSGDSTTTSGDPAALVAGAAGDIGGGGDGPGSGWIALTAGLAVLALAGWVGLAVKSRQHRLAVAATGRTGPEPVRFVLAERLAHWVYALCFLVAGITGTLMWIPSTSQWLGSAEYAFSKYHGYVGLAMVLVPLAIFLILDRRRLAETRRAMDQWDANDRRWLLAALTGGMFLRSKEMPPQGRFNAGQKINSHLVAGMAVGFVFTGVLLLMRLQLPYWLTAGVLFAHEVLAVTGGVLLLGHMAIALITRHGRGGLRAMVRGTMSREVAREGHALWYAEWLKQKRAEETAPLAGDPTA